MTDYKYLSNQAIFIIPGTDQWAQFEPTIKKRKKEARRLSIYSSTYCSYSWSGVRASGLVVTNSKAGLRTQSIPRITKVHLSNASENLRKIPIEQCSSVATGTYPTVLVEKC